MTGQDLQVTECTRSEAMSITGRLRAAVAGLESAHTATVAAVIEAFTARVWVPLGYGTWDAYCAEKIDTARVRIPRDVRVEMAAEMTLAGLSNRAIAHALGVADMTVGRDLSRRATNVAPDRAPAVLDDGPALTQEECEQLDRLDTDAAEPVRITGTDGKTYARPEPKPPTTRRRPLPDAFRSAGLDLGTRTAAIGRLAGDDRISRQDQMVVVAFVNDLIRHRDALNDAIDRLNAAAGSTR